MGSSSVIQFAEGGSNMIWNGHGESPVSKS